ncbi:MAG: PKD domain-containing protein [Candidatus Anammoxibacter sp.]
MVFKLKSSFLKHFSFFAILFFFMPILFVRHDLLAQETTIIEKSTNLLINKEVIEILQIKDSDGDLLADKLITVTVDDPSIAKISILDFIGGKDLVINEGSDLIAQTDENGRKAFIIKGASAGKTGITFEVTSESNPSTLVIEELNVNVINLEAKIQVDKDTGGEPLTVQFFNTSSGGSFVKWDFGDGSAISAEQNPEHTFENSGIFNTTLEVTETTNFGTVKATANVPIFVSPEGAGLPGIIFGTVFDLIANVPLNKAKVVLLTSEGEKQDKTGRDGVYRFANVFPGDVIITVCRPPFFECIVEEINYDGGTLLKRFELKRRGFLTITTTLP